MVVNLFPRTNLFGYLEEVNLMEREEQAMEHKDNNFAVYFTPFEIKTFRINLA